jgi:hypothetical protein
MRLYTITITARVDDLGTLDVALEADVEVDDASLRSVAMSVLPAHLRKVAADVEAQQP